MTHPPSDFAGLSSRSAPFGHHPLYNKPHGRAFDDVDTGSLRTVYALAVGALDHTHVVDEGVMRHLADAVFEAYLGAKYPRLPLSKGQVEDLALFSIDMLMQSHAEMLVIKP